MLRRASPLCREVLSQEHAGTQCANRARLPLVWKRLSLCPFTALIHAEIVKGVLKGSFLLPESILLSQVVESTPQDPLAIRCVHGTKFSSVPFENVQLPTPLLGPLVPAIMPDFLQPGFDQGDKNCTLRVLESQMERPMSLKMTSFPGSQESWDN